MNFDEQDRLAAILGLIVHFHGDDIRIPADFVNKGLPSDAGIKIEFDSDTQEVIIAIRKIENEH